MTQKFREEREILKNSRKMVRLSRKMFKEENDEYTVVYKTGNLDDIDAKSQEISDRGTIWLWREHSHKVKMAKHRMRRIIKRGK
jgi:hypothetical protein